MISRHTILRKLLFTLFIFLCFHPIYSQDDPPQKLEEIDKEIDDEIEEFYKEEVKKENLDTTYIDYEVKNWALRAFGIFKDHSFQIRNGDNRINYVPRNRFGLGLGVAYYPILLDVSINIKSKDKEPTTRFDMQFDLVSQNHYVGIVLQDYQGFDVNGPSLESPQFRQDIESFALMATYAYLFNSKKMSVGSVLSGLHKQKKSAGTFTIGGFAHYIRVMGDSSLIPSEVEDDFDDDVKIKTYSQAGVGFNGGYGHIFKLPKDFFFFIGLMPGIGIVWKESKGESEEVFKPGNPIMFRFNFKLSTGYNGEKFHVILSAGDDISITQVGENSTGGLNISKTKLIFGWKFKKKNLSE